MTEQLASEKRLTRIRAGAPPPLGGTAPTLRQQQRAERARSERESRELSGRHAWAVSANRRLRSSPEPAGPSGSPPSSVSRRLRVAAEGGAGASHTLTGVENFSDAGPSFFKKVFPSPVRAEDRSFGSDYHLTTLSVER